ncbi:MAG TPA: nitrite reductase small subunit NirD [Pseudonocardiaceae bacterium]|nr:nitrite reductase small subunit NirD [Pseudonocardiaceae bacterium]
MTVVCAYDALQAERGVAALLADGRQVAVFRTHDGSVYALDNRDPASGAGVLSRGIVGDRAGSPVVVSPIHKHAFDLRTGRCVDDERMSVSVFTVRVSGGVIVIGVP